VGGSLTVTGGCEPAVGNKQEAREAEDTIKAEEDVL
jgi:hypothetical protein